MTASFGDAFRRIGPNCWGVRPAFHTQVIAAVSACGAVMHRSSSMYSSADTTWALLDGQVVEHEGYGIRIVEYTRVEGILLVRVLAQSMGVRQPRRLPEDAEG